MNGELVAEVERDLTESPEHRWTEPVDRLAGEIAAEDGDPAA